MSNSHRIRLPESGKGMWYDIRQLKSFSRACSQSPRHDKTQSSKCHTKTLRTTTLSSNYWYHTRVYHGTDLRVLPSLCSGVFQYHESYFSRLQGNVTHHHSFEAVLAQRRNVLELRVSWANRLVYRDLRALPGSVKQVLRQIERERHLSQQTNESGKSRLFVTAVRDKI